MAESTAASRSRASVACRRCRLRKVKCDAQSLPSDEHCTPCRRAGHDCRLDPSLDGRRSFSKKHVDDLQKRIQYLESLATSTQIKDSSDISSPTGGQGRSVGPTSINSPSADVVNGLGSSQSPENPQQVVRKSPTPTRPQQRPSASSRGFEQRNTRDQVVEDLSGFFGTTSHPHVGTPLHQSNLVDQSDTIDIGIHTGSVHLETHLIHSFFGYQTLWVDVVDKDIFLAHRTLGTQSQWYGKLLENAILACATRLATSKAVRSLGQEYLQLAKSEILNALSEPTPAALQALLLLSEYEVTLGNDRIGWMFCGMACRMVSDLGLHEIGSLGDNPTNGQETTQESNLAYALLTACIVYEGVWTLYLGRPSSIPKSIMDVAAARCKAKLASDSPLLNAWLGLCVPMAEISHILNDRGAAHCNASFSLPKLMAQIQNWYDTLGPGLAYSENNLTNLDMAAYGLHTQYCKVQILLKRAFELSPNPQKRKLWQASDDATQKSVIDGAGREIYRYSLRIARLVVTYREVFGVDKVPSIMLDNAVVAATGLIQYYNQKRITEGHEERDLDWIRLLIKTLESVQTHFPITKRMLDTLRNANEGESFSEDFELVGSAKQSGEAASSRTINSDLVFPRASTQAEGMDIVAWPTEIGGDGVSSVSWANIDDMFNGIPFNLSPPYETRDVTEESIWRLTALS